MGAGFDYAKEFKQPRPRRRGRRPARADDRLRRTGGRPTGATTACSSAWPGTRRHLPHRRRPRRRGHRQPALRAAEQLARQRQPRQGAPPAVADQAEIRPQALLGRPDDPGRQRRARNRWASRPSASPAAGRHLGARGRHLLGRRDEVAGTSDDRTAATRRARAGEPARRRADGPDLREPGRPGRQSDPVASAATSARPSRAWR